jgi:citrate synthase
VVRLAAGATLEEVAALLWQSGPVTFGATPHASSSWRGLSPRQAVYLALARRAGEDPPMQGRAAAALQADGALMMGVVASAVLGAIETRAPRARRSLPPGRRPAAGPMPLHQHLAHAWRRPGAAELIRRSLVLLADHELNASTFATRVAASTGACLPACLLAGFSTLSGPAHGTAASRVLALARSASRIGAQPAIREALERGERIVAFGHPLYPEGDVRARDLMAVMPLPPLFRELLDAGVQLIGEPPNVDFALAALATGMRLPADAPFVLFALARTAGWIAHALEQHQRGSLIRPRARYTGPALASAEEI